MIAFIVLSLATWSLTNLLVQESGPGQMLHRIRHFMGVRYPEDCTDGEIAAWKERHRLFGTNLPDTIAIGPLGELFNCIRCLSLWVGVLLAALLWLDGGVSNLFIIPYALGLRAGALLVAYSLSWLEATSTPAS